MESNSSLSLTLDFLWTAKGSIHLTLLVRKLRSYIFGSVGLPDGDPKLIPRRAITLDDPRASKNSQFSRKELSCSS